MGASRNDPGEFSGAARDEHVLFFSGAGCDIGGRFSLRIKPSTCFWQRASASRRAEEDVVSLHAAGAPSTPVLADVLFRLHVRGCPTCTACFIVSYMHAAMVGDRGVGPL